MAHYRIFEELEIYKMARRQCVEIWGIITSTPFGKDYKLREQINGSSGSVMDNIAEGFGRGGNREFIQFPGFSRGSNNETRAQLQRAFDRQLIAKDQFNHFCSESEKLNDQISKFINFLKNPERRGSKFD